MTDGQDGAQRRNQPGEDVATTFTREQLYELVWREPMLRVGEKLGVSSSYMARVCTELRIPRPARGYWAQLEFGKAPSRPALPPAQPGDVTEWRPGDFIGATEREARERSKPAESSKADLTLTAAMPRQRKPVTAAEKSHPLLLGIKPLFEKSRDSEDGILRPYKRLMADVLASKEGLDSAIGAADKLYRALTSRGHRVTIAPYGAQMRRATVELREPPRKNHYQRTAWWPERPTVVYIGDVPVGLTVFEMTELVEMMYVGGTSKYVPVSSLTADQRRKMIRPHYWTTEQDHASGRLKVQAYCTSHQVAWTKQWSESKPGQLAMLIPGIVQELESAGPMLAEKLEVARREAEEMHRKWEEEARNRKEAEELARRQKRRQEARQELLTVISAWDESRRISAYFADVEKAASDAAEEDRARLLERVAHARQLIGELNPLEALLRWKAPEER